MAHEPSGESARAGPRQRLGRDDPVKDVALAAAEGLGEAHADEPHLCGAAVERARERAGLLPRVGVRAELTLDKAHEACVQRLVGLVVVRAVGKQRQGGGRGHQRAPVSAAVAAWMAAWVARRQAQGGDVPPGFGLQLGDDVADDVVVLGLGDLHLP